MGIRLGWAPGTDPYAKEFRESHGYGHGPCPACGTLCSWWTGDVVIPWACPTMPEGWSADEERTSVSWTGPRVELECGEIRLWPEVMWKSDGWYGSIEAYFTEHSSIGAKTLLGPYLEPMEAIEAVSTVRIDKSSLGAEFEHLIDRYREAFRKLYRARNAAFHRCLEDARATAAAKSCRKVGQDEK